MRKVTTVLPVAAIGLFAATFAQAQPAPAPAETGPYQLAQTFHVGGEGGMDYIAVDSRAKLLYVPRSTHTMVLDAATSKIVADIPGQQRNHGVALVFNAHRGFISDGKDGSVIIFDLKTNKVLGKVKAEEDADAIIYDSASKKVLVACGDANKVIPISPDVDPQTGKADAAVDLGGKPEGLVADGKGKVYINLVDKNEVAVVDTKEMKVINKWPVAPGGSPVGMSMDRKNRHLFIGCRNPQKLIVISADDGKVLADLPIGAGCDGTAFDNGYAFASCRDGTFAVAHESAPGKFEIVQDLKTKPGAKTLCVDPKTHAIYLPTAEFEKSTSERARPVPKPDSFMIVVVRPAGK